MPYCQSRVTSEMRYLFKKLKVPWFAMDLEPNICGDISGVVDIQLSPLPLPDNTCQPLAGL